MGLMISSAVQTQNQAQQLTALVNISGMFLGGIMFPAYALPMILRAVSFIFPMTYFIPIVRGIALKGIGIGDLWGQSLALVILLVLLLLVATRLFRQRLD
jgi:ABC-2 type transport system permease protein